MKDKHILAVGFTIGFLITLAFFAGANYQRRYGEGSKQLRDAKIAAEVWKRVARSERRETLHER